VPAVAKLQRKLITICSAGMAVEGQGLKKNREPAPTQHGGGKKGHHRSSPRNEGVAPKRGGGLGNGGPGKASQEKQMVLDGLQIKDISKKDKTRKGGGI